MNLQKFKQRLCLTVLLVIMSTQIYANESYLEAEILSRGSGASLNVEQGEVHGSIQGKSGAGIGFSGRWAFDSRFYAVAGVQTYHTDFNIFLSAISENLIAIQETKSIAAEFGLGISYPVSKRVRLEAELLRHSRVVRLDAFSLNLSSGNVGLNYDGTDLRDSGLAWRLRMTTNISDKFNMDFAVTKTDSGKIDISSQGISLAADHEFEIGARYAFTDKWHLGLTWQQADEKGVALSLRYSF